jgi:hypothetical protein
MAIINALKTGLWSDPTVGVSGATEFDQVHCNGFDVTVDVDVTVIHLSSRADGGGVAGGRFIIGGNITITADIFGGTSNNGALVDSSLYTAIVIGDVYGGDLPTSQRGIWGNFSGVVHVVGNVYAGIGNGSIGVSVSNSSQVVIAGDVVGALAGSTNGLNAGGNASSSVDVVGIVYGSIGIGLVQTGGTVRVGGAQGGSSSPGISVTGGVSLDVGEAIGGTGTSVYGVSRTGNVPVTVDRATGGTGAFSYGVYNGFDNNNVTVKSLDFRTARATPIAGYGFRFDNSDDDVWPVFMSDGVSEDNMLYELSAADHAAIADVRKDTVYSHGNLTGTLAVPPAGSVALGVPVDDTVGTAAVTLAAAPTVNDVTIQIYETDTVTPISGVLVSFWAGVDFKATGVSGVDGQVTVNLDDGSYTMRVNRVGAVFDVNIPLTVSGNTTETIYGDVVSIPVPSGPNTCRLYELAYNQASDTSLSTMTATLSIVALPYDYDGKLHAGTKIDATFIDVGDPLYNPVTGPFWYWDVVYGATCKVVITECGVCAEITIPSESTARVADLL